MPVDPTISLNVTGGKTGLMDPNSTAGTATNPLSAVQNFADTQNKLNQVTLFRQQNAARQKFGQIAAAAPSMEAAIDAASKDPTVAPFVPDIINTMSDTMKRVQDYKGLKSQQNYDAFTHTMDVVTGGLTDPGSVKKNFQNKLGNIYDPETRATVEKSGSNIVDGLTDGLDKLSPDQAKAEYVKRLFAAGAQTGTLDAMKATAGAPGEIDTGGKIVPGIRRSQVPTILGAPGSFEPAGNALTKTLAPQLATTGSVEVGPNAPKPNNANPAGASPYQALESQTGADGKPLVSKGFAGLSPVIGRGTGTGGSNVLSPEQQVQSHKLSEDFAGPEKVQYDSANNAIGSLDEMDRNVDNLARAGGVLTPGAFGETRLQFGKAANSLSQAFGGKPVFDPQAVASGEDVIKNTQRMGISTLQTMLGSQREAAETIKNMTEKGVPTLDNSVMGFKVVNASIKAAAQRQVDLRNFEEAWAAHPGNQGNLTGALKSFNDEHPAAGYINKALDGLGMNSKGFKSLPDLENAVRLGYVTEKEAEQIAKAQKFKLGE